jgi:hypothetical protein
MAGLALDVAAMKLLLTNFDPTLALADVLRAVDMPCATGFVDVLSVPSAPKRSYRLVPRLRMGGPLSQVLSGILQAVLRAGERMGHQLREARALVKVFNR